MSDEEQVAFFVTALFFGFGLIAAIDLYGMWLTGYLPQIFR